MVQTDLTPHGSDPKFKPAAVTDSWALPLTHLSPQPIKGMPTWPKFLLSTQIFPQCLDATTAATHHYLAVVSAVIGRFPPLKYSHRPYSSFATSFTSWDHSLRPPWCITRPATTRHRWAPFTKLLIASVPLHHVPHVRYLPVHLRSFTPEAYSTLSQFFPIDAVVVPPPEDATSEQPFPDSPSSF
jgi:hypothetical protein